MKELIFKVNAAEDKIEEPDAQSKFLEKIKQEDSKMYEGLSSLLKKLCWAIDEHPTSKGKVLNFIYTAIKELDMRYSDYTPSNLERGDIVMCNYGEHVEGETNGGYVPAVVCDLIGGNRVYLVPLKSLKYKSDSFIIIKKENITSQYDLVGYSIITKEGRYVNRKRIRAIIGKCDVKFLREILRQISLTFDFGHLFFDSLQVEDEENEQTELKLTYTEKSLLKFTSKAWKILETDEEPEKKLDKFLSKMGMLESEEDQIIKRSFIIAIILDRVTYPNLLTSLKKNYYRNESENDLQKNLKRRFNKWLEKNPRLKEESPRISFTDVLGLFKKLWNN